MAEELVLEDIDTEIKEKIYTQEYSGNREEIEGVKVVDLKNHVGEDGDFLEIIRIKKNSEVENFEGFKVAQLNKSSLLPNALKAWHLHLRQDELFYVLGSSFNSLIALWDLRKNSKTKGNKMRIVFGGGGHRMLFIPKGVAHGIKNLSNSPIYIIYMTNNNFNKDNPDEKRLKWDSLGKEFWEPARD